MSKKIVQFPTNKPPADEYVNDLLNAAAEISYELAQIAKGHPDLMPRFTGVEEPRQQTAPPAPEKGNGITLPAETRVEKRGDGVTVVTFYEWDYEPYSVEVFLDSKRGYLIRIPSIVAADHSEMLSITSSYSKACDAADLVVMEYNYQRSQGAADPVLHTNTDEYDSGYYFTFPAPPFMEGDDIPF